MATKTLKTVIQLRHDTTANWETNKNFVKNTFNDEIGTIVGK